jgi:hypothetical protein
VPLPTAAREQISLSDEWRWAQLANLVEAWGFRASHARERLLSREEMARAWFDDEYKPVVELLRAAESGAGAGAAGGGGGTETERYLRVAMLRFLLLHTHELTDDVVERVLGEAKAPGAEADTMVHQLLKEMR